MKKLLLILLFIPHLSQARKVTATVSSGQVSVLTNAQSVYSLDSGDTLDIPATAVNYIAIGNITSNPGTYIYITCASRILMNGTFTAFEIANLTRVKFIFRDATYGYGLWITNSSYRCITVSGDIHDVTLFGIYIYKPPDYAMYLNHTKTHDNTYANKNTNLTLDSIKIRGGTSTADAIHFESGNTTGYWDSIYITRNTVDSMSGGYIYDLHSCFNITLTADSILHSGGIADTAHRAGFYVRGHLRSADRIYINDLWGDGFRLNCYALTPAKANGRGNVYITNSSVTNSRKYPFCEINNDLNQFDSSSQYLVSVNYHIANCTAGMLRAKGYIEESGGGGAAFDCYKHGGGTIEILNCIGYLNYYDIGPGQPYSYLFHNGDGSGIVNDSTGTVYDATGTVYLSDTLNGGVTKNPGPAVNAGPRVSYVTGSSNGLPRPASGLFTIGRMEFPRYTGGVTRKLKIKINKP